MGVLQALLIAPAVWALIPVWCGGDAGLPIAGPELLEGSRRHGSVALESPLVDYLVVNRGEEPFLVAALNANTAAPIIVATGEPVMTLGGFSGGDHILSMDDLAERVAGSEERLDE